MKLLYIAILLISSGLKAHTIEGLIHPESALVTNSSLFISDMGEDTGAVKNGDGNLLKYHHDGTINSDFELKTPLHSPMGMALNGDTLYIADVDRVVGIHSESGELVFAADFSSYGATFLNDLVVIDQRYIVVSATALKKIFVHDLILNKSWELIINLEGRAPNGLAWDEQERILWFAANKAHTLGDVGNGQILQVTLNDDFKQGEASLFQELGRFLDGIVVTEDKIFVSDWFGFGADGKVYEISRAATDEVQTFELALSGLADFSYDTKTNKFYMPELTQGRVQVLELAQ